MTVVCKLGGSVITEKHEPETVDDAALDRAASDVAMAGPDDLVLVHGGGSFGHHHAAAHGVDTDAGTRDTDAVAAIHSAMTALNRTVTTRLRDNGVAAVPVHPLSAGFRDHDGDLSLPTGQVAALLAEGFVPVLHGDLVAHRGAGATVVSGDELVVSLAASLDADRVGLCSTVPGVLDDDGAVIPEIGAYEEVAAVLGDSDATDVTGGMAAKVRALLAIDAPASVFGPDALAGFLRGEAVGTRIDGG